MPRGGARRGKPGKSYPNRVDLSRHGFTNQTYGTAQAQEQAVAAVPAKAAPEPPEPPGMPDGAPNPGSLGPLFGPSGKPGEPVTAGAALGPGPGPEALGLTGQDSIKAGDYEALKPWLPVLNFQASRRASPSGAEFIRQLRLSSPPGGR